MNRRPSSNLVRSHNHPNGAGYSRSGNLNDYPPEFDEEFDARPPRRSGDGDRFGGPAGPRPQRRPPTERNERNPGPGRRSPRQSGKPTPRKRTARARRLRTPYRYGALGCMMVFAAIGGMCIALSGLGGPGGSVGLLFVAVPAFLLSLGSAALYVYF